MRLTTSTSTARIGNVEIRGVQHVLELEALDTSFEAISNTPRGSHHHTYSPTKSQSVSPEDLYAVQSRTAIVVPCKDESLERIHGVWAAIPSSSLIILVSASEVEAYVQERTKLANFCRLTGRNAIAIHQCDPTIAAALRAVGLPELLDDKGDGLVHRGKGEALAIGIALAATARGPPDTKSIGQRTGEDTCGCYTSEDEVKGHLQCDLCDNYQTGSFSHRDTQHTCTCRRAADCTDCCQAKTDQAVSCTQRPTENTRSVCGYYKYIGFVDADNFIPGSVHEYCRAFSAGLHLAQAEDSMVRISWASKPKVHNGKIEFKQLGRSSEIVNQWLNKLLEKMDANIETDADASRETEAPGLICTGNAGEHAMTLSLALKLRVASGYAIEPFHFLDILERFVGGQDASVIGNMDKRGKTAASSPSTLPTPATDAEQPLGLLKSLSLLPSPAQSPMDGSPVMSTPGGSIFPTSPSVVSTDLCSVPANQPLPPSLISRDSYQTMEAHTPAPNDITPPNSPISATEQPKPTIQILQIRTINPHFHDNKGEAHIARMWKQGLSAIYHSPLTHVDALTQYCENLRSAIFCSHNGNGMPNMPTPSCSGGVSSASVAPRSADDNSSTHAAVVTAAKQEPERCRIYPPTGTGNLFKLRARLESQGGSFWWSGIGSAETSRPDRTLQTWLRPGECAWSRASQPREA